MPLLMLGALGVATVISMVVISIDPGRAAGALTPILLLQLFACSSGFDVPARRGHYDLLLTQGEARHRIVVGHWLASAFPGLVSWILLAACCFLAAAGGERRALFNAGTLSAMSLVSTIPWATSVRLPRFSGAIGWLLIGVTVSLAMPELLAIEIEKPIETWAGWLQAAAAVLVYPTLLVGEDLSRTDARVVLPGVLCAAGALAVAFWSVTRRDIPLEAAQ
jgi:hypothetical protein